MSHTLSVPFRARRRVPALKLPLAGAVAAAAILAAGQVLPLHVYADETAVGWHSAGQDLVPWHDSSWLALQYPGIALVAIIAAAALVTGRWHLGRAAVGLLIGIGGAGYVVAFGILGYTLKSEPAVFHPRIGALVLLTGAAIALGSGLLAYHRPTRPPSRAAPAVPLVRWCSRLLGLAAAGAIAAGTVYAWAETSSQSVTVLSWLSQETWLALGPLGIAAAVAALAVATFRDRDRQLVAAGALVALGITAGLAYVGYVGVAASVGSPVTVGLGAMIGLGGAVGAIAAGVALVPRWKHNAAATASEASAAVPHATVAGPEVTRYLCAAANLDESYAKAVTRHIVEEEHRAVAPSHGVDIIPVLRHALAMRGRTAVRDVVLALALVPLLLVPLLRPTLAGLLAAVAILVAAWAFVFAEQWTNRYRILARHLTRAAYDPHFGTALLSPVAEAQLASIEHAAAANVTIYSGFRPFIGSGFDNGGWSLAIDVGRARDRARPVERFSLDELYDCVVGPVQALGLQAVSFDDQLYVDGEGIRDDARFVPDRFERPSGVVAEGVIRAHVGAVGGAVRHYRCIRFAGWDGELVVSLFLRFDRSGDLLFFESKQYVLAPLKDVYHTVDRLQPSPIASQRLAFVLRSTGTTLKLLALAIPRLVGRGGHQLRRWWQRRTARRLIRGIPTFDYGARTSVRELAQSHRYQRYFQQVDRDMVAKVVERRVLDAVAEFLALRNVDVAELAERRDGILDRNLVVDGGRHSAAGTVAPVEEKPPTAGGVHWRQIGKRIVDFLTDLMLKLAER